MKKMQTFEFGIIALVISITGIMGCQFFQIVGNGTPKTEQRTVSSFAKLDVAIPAEVYITDSDERTIRIEAESNIMPLIENNVTNKSLRLDFSKQKVSPSKPIKIWLSGKTIQQLTLSGSGKIIGQIVFKNDIDVENTGSGTIDIQAQNKNIDVLMSGSGIVTMKGSTQKTKWILSGSGQIQGYSLQTVETNVSLSGSGKCRTQPTSVLDAFIEGSGIVFYRGNPTIKVKNVGSGKLTKES